MKKNGRAIPTNPLELNTFIKNWKNALRRQSALWEGPKAVHELSRRGVLDLVRCELNHWLFPDLLTRAIAEMRYYSRETLALNSGGLLMEEQFKEVDRLFQIIEGKIQKTKSKIRIAEISSILDKTSRSVKKNRNFVLRHRRQQRKELHSQLGAWERLFGKYPSKRMVTRQIQLDTRLQVQLGKNFLRTLRLQDGHTLSTIARLVLLAYWVGDLAAEDESSGILRLRSTGRKLTVKNVQDALREAGLHRKRFAEPQTRRATPIS